MIQHPLYGCRLSGSKSMSHTIETTPILRSVHVACCRKTTHRDSSRRDILCRAVEAFQAGIIPLKWPVVVPKTDVVSIVDGLYTVAGEAIVPSSLSLIMTILNDHDNSAKVFSNVESSFSSITDAGVLVTQVVRWKVLLFSGTFNYQLNVAHDPVENTVIFRMLSSSFMSACEGTWKLVSIGNDQPLNIGSSDAGNSNSTGNGSSSAAQNGSVIQSGSDQQESSTLIKHTLSVRLAMSIPDAVTRQVAPIFQKQVHTVMEDLLREIQRQEMERRELVRREALLQTAVPL